jgi:hypothetical protein
MAPKIPTFCDFDCPHADFPPADTAGICRTMAGVWCRKLKQLVNKNVPCAWRKQEHAEAPRPKATPKKSIRSSGPRSS